MARGRRGPFKQPVRKDNDREEGIILDGEIVENLPNAQFRVHLNDMDKTIIAHVSGKMRKNWIRLMAGDRVKVEFSPYDLDRARIVYRHRD